MRLLPHLHRFERWTYLDGHSLNEVYHCDCGRETQTHQHSIDLTHESNVRFMYALIVWATVISVFVVAIVSLWNWSWSE